MDLLAVGTMGGVGTVVSAGATNYSALTSLAGDGEMRMGINGQDIGYAYAQAAGGGAGGPYSVTAVETYNDDRLPRITWVVDGTGNLGFAEQSLLLKTAATMGAYIDVLEVAIDYDSMMPGTFGWLFGGLFGGLSGGLFGGLSGRLYGVWWAVR